MASRPWKFQVVEGLAREELGSKMASAAKKSTLVCL